MLTFDLESAQMLLQPKNHAAHFAVRTLQVLNFTFTYSNSIYKNSLIHCMNWSMRAYSIGTLELLVLRISDCLRAELSIKPRDSIGNEQAFLRIFWPSITSRSIKSLFKVTRRLLFRDCSCVTKSYHDRDTHQTHQSFIAATIEELEYTLKW